MSSRRDATRYEELRKIVSANWKPPQNPFDEVYPNIYIGDAITALSLRTLKWEGISHVINGALACASCLRKEICGGCVLTRDSYYVRDGIAFLGVQANDERRFPLYRSTAMNVSTLEGMRVTHILNAAFGSDSFRYVNTSEEFYSSKKFAVVFYGIRAMDLTAYQLHPFFESATEFIQKALDSPSGKVLVHCREGISRSATLVLAYLMMKKDMTAMEAVKLVRSKRQIFPNDGFLEQLCDLDIRLRGERNIRER